MGCEIALSSMFRSEMQSGQLSLSYARTVVDSDNLGRCTMS
jgi:hypothetical protein